MSEDRDVVRSVSWRDLFPWLILFRTFGISITIPVLLFATIGVLLTPLGWRTSELLFLPATAAKNADSNKRNVSEGANPKKFLSDLTSSLDEQIFQELVERNRSWAPLANESTLLGKLDNVGPLPSGKVVNASPLPKIFQRFTEPYIQIFEIDLTFTRIAYFLGGGLWTLCVWSFCGGAISRIAVMQLGGEQRVGLRDALAHAREKWLQYFMAPLAPLVLVAVITLPVALLGLCMWVTDWGVVMAGILWILVILASFLSGLLLLGLLFGWPLMWGTIASEESDAFDALSRSYGYTFQRPLHYLFYAFVATLLGMLAWTLVDYFSFSVEYLGYWGVSWGLDDEKLQLLRDSNVTHQSSVLSAGTGLIQMFNSLIAIVATAFRYSFFWCAAAAIYLLLRRDVDQTEFDEIHFEEEEQPLGLPKMTPDEKGVPDLATEESGESSETQADSE